jgi:hypothetical protein
MHAIRMRWARSVVREADPAPEPGPGAGVFHMWHLALAGRQAAANEA